MASSLRANSIYSLVGFLVPTLVLFVSYPLLLAALGSEGFGVFNVATTLGGMVGFLDFGFGAATVKFLSGAVARGDRDAGRDTVQASLRFFLVLGAAVGMSALVASPWLVTAFRVQESMRQDALLAFRIAAFQIVFVFQINAFVAMLKGMQLYRFASSATAALAALNYGGATAATAGMGFGLVGATAASTLASGIVAVAAGFAARKALHSQGMWGAGSPGAHAYRRLVSYGSVTTLNGMASLVVTQLPRYVVGVAYGPSAVTVYTVASSVAVRVHAVAAAAAEAFFPFASAAACLADLRRPYRRMLLGSAALAAAATAPLVLAADPILTLWVGADLAMEAAPLLRVFALAYFVIALSPAPFYLANGIGAPWRNTIFIGAHLGLYVFFVGGLLRTSELRMMSVAYGQLAANVIAVAGLLVATKRLFAGEAIRSRAG